MAKDSPSARTKRLFEECGYIVGACEHVNVYAGPPHLKCQSCGKNRIGKKNDLFGIADHIVFHVDKPGVTLVQSTSGTNHSARRVKILASEIALKWVKHPERQIAIMSWTKKAKKKQDGTRSKVKEWSPRLEYLVLADFGKDTDANKTTTA